MSEIYPKIRENEKNPCRHCTQKCETCDCLACKTKDDLNIMIVNLRENLKQFIDARHELVPQKHLKKLSKAYNTAHKILGIPDCYCLRRVSK